MRVDVNQLIGLNGDGELVMLHDIFDHGAAFGSKRFKGATGCTFVPVYQDEIDYANDVERIIEEYGYLWFEMSHRQRASFDFDMKEWAQAMIDDSDLFFGYDPSWADEVSDELREALWPNSVAVQSVSCGRIFPRVLRGMELVFESAEGWITDILNAEHVCRIYDI